MQYFSYAIFLAAILLLCVETQAYCIYNFLDNGGSFIVFDNSNVPNNYAFRKTLEYNGAKECCHYEDKGYNPSQSKTAPLSFGVQFKFNKDGNQAVYSRVFFTSCTAGGALAFYGTSTDYYGICISTDGFPNYDARLE